MLKAAGAALLICVVGCSSGSGTGDRGSGGSGGGSTNGWLTLVEGDWALASGDEDYLCVRKTMTENVYVSVFRPKLPPGTHHTVLTLETNPSEPDGSVGCDAGTNGPHMIYGSGVGTSEFSLPEGVAVPVKAGQQLVLNLHLFNTGAGSLSGTSGIEVKTTSPDGVLHEAQVTLAGKQQGLVALPGTSTDHGVCTLEAETNVFAILPHMHQLGAHLKATALPASGSPITLLDVDYTFDDQQFFPLNPQATLALGDQIAVDCTYDNPTAAPVYYGDSSTDEMCFAAVFEYPARNRSSYYCTN